MELKLEHVAPYLPYRLMAEILDYQSDYVGNEYDWIVGIHQWDKTGLMWSLETEGGAKPGINRVKPVFTPLSELSSYSNGLRQLGNRADKNNIDNLISDIESGKADYDVMQMCFKERIDVFGLIEKGLAIDINTLPLNE